MKRMAIRRRAKKPRSWENRRDRNAYMLTHPCCQMCGQLADDPHHLCGKEWLGADNWRNLLALCRRCHDEVHAQSNRGKVRALFVKFRSGCLDLDWYANKPGYSVSGSLDGRWRETCGAEELLMIHLMLMGIGMADITEITGRSDDLIELDGAISDEFYPQVDDTGYLHFACGTVVKVSYNDEGRWIVELIKLGDGVHVVNHQTETTEDEYSQKLELRGLREPVYCFDSAEGPSSRFVIDWWKDTFDPQEYKLSALTDAFRLLTANVK